MPLAETRVLFDGFITITNGGSSSSLSPGTFTATGQNGAAAPTTFNNQGFAAGTLNSAPFKEIKVIAFLDTLAGGTTPTVALHIGVVDGRNAISQLDAFTAFSAQGSSLVTSIGPGMAQNGSLADTLAFFWTLTGAPTNVVMYIRVVGKS